MGVIKRQSVKQSIVSYVGVGIAAISTIFIYPLDKEVYGLAAFILGTAQFFAPFILLGINGVSIRYFPQFNEERKGGHGFLFFIVAYAVIGILLFILGWWLFQDQIYSWYDDKPVEYYQFFPQIVGLAILFALLNLFTSYASNYKRIVVPAILQNTIKVLLPILILLYVYKGLKVDALVDWIIGNYILITLLIIGYIYSLGALKWKPDFSWFTASRKKEMSVYAMYFMLGGIGSVMALQIDNMMIPKMVNFEGNGAYRIAAFIANVIAIPTVAIIKIASPIVSESFKKDDLAHVNYLYKQSSINLLSIGFFLYVCILASVEDLFGLMKNSDEMVGGFLIVALIGAARIIDMGTSINNPIINHSKYFRFNLFAILLLGVLNVVANYLLIPRFGIVGAAMATLGALLMYNLVKLCFIYWKFKMLPFSWQTLQLLLLAIACYVVASILPLPGIPILDIIIRSMVVAFLYGSTLFYFNISSELVGMVKGFVNKWIK